MNVREGLPACPASVPAGTPVSQPGSPLKGNVCMEIERYREQAHEVIDQRINDFILSRLCGDLTAYVKDGLDIKPLLSPAKAFKGTKPAALILPKHGRVETFTWQQAAHRILLDCDDDPVRHQHLMAMRNRIAGNFRWLLSDTPEEMQAPLKINDELYFEGKFDTEALLLNMTRKVLLPAGYDYSGIVVVLRRSKANRSHVT